MRRGRSKDLTNVLEEGNEEGSRRLAVTGPHRAHLAETGEREIRGQGIEHVLREEAQKEIRELLELRVPELDVTQQDRMDETQRVHRVLCARGIDETDGIAQDCRESRWIGGGDALGVDQDREDEEQGKDGGAARKEGGQTEERATRTVWMSVGLWAVLSLWRRSTMVGADGSRWCPVARGEARRKAGSVTEV